jgi:hypothetical protein
VTVPTVEGLLTVPYVSVAEFSASPTWLDVDDLVPGGVANQQVAELYNVLLRASDWADEFCGQRLGAHTVYEQARTRVSRDGLVYLHPSNVPVRQVTGIAYGTNFQKLTALSDLTQVWVEDARGIVVSMLPLRGSFAGTLEFGTVPSTSAVQVFVEYQYTAGYCSTTLSGPVTAAATSLPLVDPTGLQAPSTTLIGSLSGSTARIWDSGLEEAVTVASGYTAGTTPVPITTGLLNPHQAGTSVSELPAQVHQAITCFAVSLMLREDVAGEEPFAGTPYGPALRRSKAGGAAGGLLDSAYEMLAPYRRVR